jgi:hypothetical protein
VAERKGWAKFGNEKGKGAGPSVDTTTVGENIFFRPSVSWKRDARDEGKKAEEETMKDKLRDKKVKCRICDGEHFTARCPYKDTMAPAGEPAGGAGAGMDDDGDKEGGLGIGGSSYVPPHLRKGAAGREGDRMGGKFERDDFATLRVTNVSRGYAVALSSHADSVARCRNSQTRTSFAASSSAMAVSRECFSPKTGRLDVQRALRSLVSRRVRMLRERVISSMDVRPTLLNADRLY